LPGTAEKKLQLVELFMSLYEMAERNLGLHKYLLILTVLVGMYIVLHKSVAPIKVILANSV